MALKKYNDWLKRYSESLPETSRRIYTNIAEDFLKWAGTREIDGPLIRAYINKLRKDRYADGTILKTWSIIRRVYIVNNGKDSWPFVRGDAPIVNESSTWAPAMDPEDIKEMVDVVLGKLHLEEWGFTKTLSTSKLSDIFVDLKGMIGFQVEDVGWHSIRRSAVSAAFSVNINEAAVSSFYRWKRSTTNMAIRYGTSRVISKHGEHRELGMEDRKIDELFYENHPFMEFWKNSSI